MLIAIYGSGTVYFTNCTFIFIGRLIFCKCYMLLNVDTYFRCGRLCSYGTCT